MTGPVNAEVPESHAIHIIYVEAPSVHDVGATLDAGAAARRGNHLVKRTLGEAMKVASDGDIIEVAPGVYTEGILLSKAVTLYAAAAGKVVVKSDGDPTVVSTAHGARLRNISFEHTGGDASARGRAGPRCLEVVGGYLTCDGCSFTSKVGSAVMAAENGCTVLPRVLERVS
jgi:hypothetical protein